ncbi:Membrane metallo-endopeptidase-like 1, partial [Bulinus truncatus]
MTSSSTIPVKVKEVTMVDYDNSTNNSQAVLSQEDISFTKSGRSLLEKILLLLLVVFIVALIAVVAALIVEKNKDHSTFPASKSPEVSEETCFTKDCVLAAAAVDRAIDYSVDPCDNFYQFACGRWKREHVIPEDQSSLSIFVNLRDQTEIILKSLLEETGQLNELPSIGKAKTLYSSCTNYSLINKRGDAPLKELLLQALGGWPLIHKEWNDSNFDLVNLIQKLNLHGIYSIMPFYASTDQKDSNKRILKIDQPSFGMPGQKYYLVSRNDTMLMAYENLIFSTCNLMGLANQSNATEEVKAVVDFEIQLANISVPDEQRRDSNALYNPMTLAEIQGNYSRHFNWSRYVVELLSSPEVGVTDISESEIIINQSPVYYQRLNDLFDVTPK